MRNKDAFSGYHPTINFLYYALVLLFSMCLMHPVYLAISLTGALAYDIYLKGRKAVRFAVMGLLPMAAVAALVNPAFNHEGQTILTYLPSGNPLTLESMFYGVAAAVMLASIVLWFSSYNEVMTSDTEIHDSYQCVRTWLLGVKNSAIEIPSTLQICSMVSTESWLPLQRETRSVV